MKTVNRSVGAFVVATALVLGVSAFQQNKPRDPEEAFDKLRRIGAALQLYRAEYGSKPVAERRTYSDAGLPPVISMLAQPGHAWTLPMSDFQLSYSRHGDANNWSEFICLYWPDQLAPELGEISHYYALRGEKLPIMSDEDLNSELPPRSYIKRCPALRLDGTVDWIEYDYRHWPERLER